MAGATIPLTNLSRELQALTGQKAPPYARLWRCVVDGVIPAEKSRNAWQVQVADLPVIARALGLTAT